MKKNTLSVIVDSLMIVLFVMLFKKNVINLKFHEIAGLAVCAIFIIHIIINYKWIAGVTKNLFAKSTPVKTRLCYLVDFVLCVCFIGLLISGIDCSKKLFPNLPVLSYKSVAFHFFFAAIMLLSVGIHLGMHWSWIKGMITRHGKWCSKIYSSIRNIIIVFLSCFGAYSLFTSEIGKWLKAPFVSTANAAHGMGGGVGFGNGNHTLESFTVMQVISNCFGLVIKFASITLFIAFVIVMIEKLIKNINSRKLSCC